METIKKIMLSLSIAIIIIGVLFSLVNGVTAFIVTFAISSVFTKILLLALVLFIGIISYCNVVWQ